MTMIPKSFVLFHTQSLGQASSVWNVGHWTKTLRPFCNIPQTICSHFCCCYLFKKYTDGKVDSEYLFSNKHPRQQTTSSAVFQCTKEQSGLSRTSLQLCDWRCDWLNEKGIAFFFFFFRKAVMVFLNGRNQNRNKIYTNHVNNINRKIYFETVGALLFLATQD